MLTLFSYTEVITETQKKSKKSLLMFQTKKFFLYLLSKKKMKNKQGMHFGFVEKCSLYSKLKWKWYGSRSVSWCDVYDTGISVPGEQITQLNYYYLITYYMFLITCTRKCSAYFVQETVSVVTYKNNIRLIQAYIHIHIY